MVKVAPNHYLVQLFHSAISMSVYKVYTSATALSNMVLSAHFLPPAPPSLASEHRSRQRVKGSAPALLVSPLKL